MKSITAVLMLAVLVLGAGLIATPAQAKSINVPEVIKRAFKRDQNRCRVKWGRALAKCKKAQNPTLDNDCGHALPTTTSTSTTTTTSTSSSSTTIKCPPPPPPSTSTSTTTTIPCDGSHTWAPCGPAGGTCTCHQDISSTGAYECAEAGTQFGPMGSICPDFKCTTDADCKLPDCINNAQATMVCIKGSRETDPFFGRCFCICGGTVCS